MAQMPRRPSGIALPAAASADHRALRYPRSYRDDEAHGETRSPAWSAGPVGTVTSLAHGGSRDNSAAPSVRLRVAANLMQHVGTPSNQDAVGGTSNAEQPGPQLHRSTRTPTVHPWRRDRSHRYRQRDVPFVADARGLAQAVA